MLEEGFVATGYNDDSAGDTCLRCWLLVALRYRRESGEQTLTAVVAQIRGLRLLQSLAPDEDWSTTFGGYQIPADDTQMLRDCVINVADVYDRLTRRPPWGDGVPWEAQEIAGHAKIRSGLFDAGPGGQPMFVGENGDLLWRALTETDHYGQSPLKQALQLLHTHPPSYTTMAAAAALYDETAEQQLTTGLFDGMKPSNLETTRRVDARRQAAQVFRDELNPEFSECRWTPQQQTRLRSFIDTIDALQP